MQRTSWSSAATATACSTFTLRIGATTCRQHIRFTGTLLCTTCELYRICQLIPTRCNPSSRCCGSAGPSRAAAASLCSALSSQVLAHWKICSASLTVRLLLSDYRLLVHLWYVLYTRCGPYTQHAEYARLHKDASNEIQERGSPSHLLPMAQPSPCLPQNQNPTLMLSIASF